MIYNIEISKQKVAIIFFAPAREFVFTNKNKF